MAKGSTKDFTNAVDKWIAETEAESNEIYRETVRGVVAKMQEEMPHASGNLRRSVTVSLSQSMPLGEPDEVFADPSASNNAVIDSLTLKDEHVYVGVRAAYGPRDNYGQVTGDIKNRPGKFWFEKTGAAFKGIAKRVAATRGRRVK